MTMLTVKEIGKNDEKALHKLGGGVAMELGCEKGGVTKEINK
jgi:hypothetical protein